MLYLRGLSTNDFAPALEGFFGSAAGLSASTIQRLTEAWRAEHARWCARDLSDVDYVYIWVDGIYVNVRLPDTTGAQDRLCLLVMVGVRLDGSKELVAVTDGHREDTQSWLDLLRDLRDRGMRAPELAVGDGALGFWAALTQVFGSTQVQRCWVHKVANCLAALPKRLHADAQGRAREDLHRRDPRLGGRCRCRVRPRLRRAPQGRREDRRRPRCAVDVLRLPGRALEAPADHERGGVALRDGAVAPADHQGAGLPGRGVGDAYKLLDAAQARWRRINGPELVALVRAGATFIDGRLQERSDTDAHAA